MPSFQPRHCLARYIGPDHRNDDKRAKATAFLEDYPSGTVKKPTGLSVNTLELETINQIADNYGRIFGEKRPVGISAPTVEDYNKAAAHVGVLSGYHDQEPHWTHVASEGNEASYVLHEHDKNKSHCLVKYTTSMDYFSAFRFAVHMARTPRFKMV